MAKARKEFKIVLTLSEFEATTLCRLLGGHIHGSGSELEALFGIYDAVYYELGESALGHLKTEKDVDFITLKDSK